MFYCNTRILLAAQATPCDSFRDIGFHDAEVISLLVSEEGAVVTLSGVRLFAAHAANQSGTTVTLDRAVLSLRKVTSCRLRRFDDNLRAMVPLESTSALLEATIVQASYCESIEMRCVFSFEGWSVALGGWVECHVEAASASLAESLEPGARILAQSGT